MLALKISPSGGSEAPGLVEDNVEISELSVASFAGDVVN